jgi:signal transduction histidine kinase
MNEEGASSYSISLANPFVILSIMSILLIIFLLLILKNIKRKHRLEVLKLNDTYAGNLQNAQIKVKEETLNYIAAEIHDHIGQLLAVVKLNLAMQKDPKLDEPRALVSRIIKDMREMVQSMKADKVRYQNLSDSIENEVKRLQQTSAYSITFRPRGEPFLFKAEKQVGIFRIFQECITNIIKHSDAKNIAVELYFQAKLFTLVIRDDGQGFDNSSARMGVGLQNMEYRAQLLGARLEVDTSPGTGCSVTLTIIP